MKLKHLLVAYTSIACLPTAHPQSSVLLRKLSEIPITNENAILAIIGGISAASATAWAINNIDKPFTNV